MLILVDKLVFSIDIRFCTFFHQYRKLPDEIDYYHTAVCYEHKMGKKAENAASKTKKKGREKKNTHRMRIEEER